MISKKELQEQFNLLKHMLEDVNARKDSQNEWATSQIIALRAEIDAANARANLFSDTKEESDKELTPKIQQTQKYQIPDSVATHYWWKINRIVDSMIGVFRLKHKCPFKYNAIHNTIKYALLFGRSCLDISDKDNYISCILTQIDFKNKTYKYIENNSMFNSNSITNRSFKWDNDKQKFNWNEEQKEFKKDSKQILCFHSDLMVGLYVLMIPYLCKFILFERQLDKTVTYINIMTSTKNANESQAGQCANALTDADCFYIDETIDDQVGVRSNTLRGDKIRWWVPPVEIKETFEVQRFNKKDVIEEMNIEFGLPIEKTSTKQHLASDSDISIEEASLNGHSWCSWILLFLEQLKKEDKDVEFRNPFKDVYDAHKNLNPASKQKSISPDDVSNETKNLTRSISI